MTMSTKSKNIGRSLNASKTINFVERVDSCQSRVWRENSQYLQLRQRQLANISKEGPSFLTLRMLEDKSWLRQQSLFIICHIDEEDVQFFGSLQVSKNCMLADIVVSVMRCVSYRLLSEHCQKEIIKLKLWSFLGKASRDMNCDSLWLWRSKRNSLKFVFPKISRYMLCMPILCEFFIWPYWGEIPM